MRRYILTVLLVGLCGSVCAQQISYRYWFDDDTHIINKGVSDGDDSFTIDVDVSSLAKGIHYLHYQVADTSGIYSPPRSVWFRKTAMAGETIRFCSSLYLDNEHAVHTEMEAVMAGGSDIIALPPYTAMVNVEELQPGIHTMAVTLNDSVGVPLAVGSHYLYRAPKETSAEEFRYDCYIDNQDKPFMQSSEPDMTVDVSSLPEGMHLLFFMMRDDRDGTIKDMRTAFFYRAPLASDYPDGEVQYHYYLDNEPQPFKVSNNAEGLIDLGKLDGGMHQMLCVVTDRSGKVSDMACRYFMVKEMEDIVRYEYWVNDNADSVSVVGVPHGTPYTSVETLSVGNYPLRSSSFHFVLDDGIPYIYAKNDLHVRFYAANGTCVEDSRTFTDATVCQEVTGLLPLLSGTPRTDATPAANSIRWYRLEAYADNELSFRVSQPCTVQLFSPEGAVLLDVCGTAVTDTFSCRSTTGGSYYVALHDVTGTEDETTIEYLHEGHVLTFMVDGEVYSCDTLAYGVPVTAPELPEREGYSCTGWSEVPATMPAHDVTVTGSYVFNSVQTDAQGLIYTLAEERDAFTVSGYTDSLVADVAIPAELYGLPVSAIAEDALADAGVLASIVVPHSVERVGDDAFCGCTALLVVDWLSSAPLSARSFDRPSSYGNMLVFVSDASTEVTFDGNIVTEGTAREIVLIDGLPFRNPRDFTADYISYSRDFTKPTEPGVAGGWEALVVPFNVERITSSSKGALAPIGLADHTSTLPSWVAEWADSTASFLLVDAIRANEPFIMSVPNSDKYEDKYNVQGTISFSAENAVVRSTEKCGYAASEGFSFVGSYEGVACDATVYALNDEEYTAVDGVVYMAGGVFAPALRDVRPFESYVTHEGVHKAPYLRIGGRDDTGIVNVVISTTDDGWYTLQGIRLNGKPTDKGVYIINRKKVIID